MQETILLLGSGALKIGEAGEFDYSGTQAIKALKEEGKRIVLVNPNVATVQTSVGLADEIYFMPVTAAFVEQIIQKEKPHGILLSFGGQTALNCGIELHKKEILKKYRVKILGTPIEAILATEDRQLFARQLSRIGLPTARGKTVKTVEEGLRFAEKLGYPVMLRAGFALGGTGSGVATTPQKLGDLLTKAFAATDQVIVEESLYGWKEVEYEVVRDKNDNCITVCNMENFDPVGIHTGESIVVAPSQTLNDREYYSLRQTSIAVIKELGIIGECNIQYALNPKNSEFRIIEVNARLSRSSALASKATGYPLAYVAAKLSLGKTLPELKNAVTQETSAFFEPALDYIVVKIPRWDLDKFIHVDAGIGSEMKSVGEVMSIARTFEEAIQKAARMLNDGYEGVIDKNYGQGSRKELLEKIKRPNSMRLFDICSGLRAGISVETIHNETKIDRWFLEKLKNITDVYQQISKKKTIDKELLKKAKEVGYADKQIGDIANKDEQTIRKLRKKYNIYPVTKQIDTLAGEFPARTNYLYMTYSGEKSDHIANSKDKKVIVLGCGPYAIGTSVEFDWCAVNTVNTLRQEKIKSVMINCNPETVSTDFDTADYLYFEELSLERILDIYDIEKCSIIISVGGQIPNNLGPKLEKLRVPILGTKASDIFTAENRESFSKLLDKLDIDQPMWGEAHSVKDAIKLVKKIGFPILVRPSFVLSGKSMTVIDTEAALETYMKTYDLSWKAHPLVITKFLESVVECDFDGVAQKGTILISALSEHIESGGVHSGDSSQMLPAVTLSTLATSKINEIVKKICKALRINGPFNIQFLIQDDTPYVIECNLRSSRSFPFVSKVLNKNFVSLATQIALGKKQKQNGLQQVSYQAVKVPQFSFHKLRGADPVVKVEMGSTGEVSAFGADIFEAYLIAILATGLRYPTKKSVFLSLGGASGKLQFLRGARMLDKLGFTFYATEGTHFFLRENMISSERVAKNHQGGDVSSVDLFKNKKIDFAVVIPEHYADRGVKTFHKTMTDGYLMRRLAVDMGIPIFSNASSAKYFVEALYRYTFEKLHIKSWREYIIKGGAL